MKTPKDGTCNIKQVNVRNIKSIKNKKAAIKELSKFAFAC